MMSRRFCLAVLLLPLGFAHAAVVECPANAPAAWKVGKAPLERARVLGYLPGDKLEEKALPEGPPDKEWQRRGTLYQQWDVKAGAPPMIYQVDCLYTGTSRILRLDADRVAQCVGKQRVRGETIVPGTLEFRCQ
jgi:hypothetical protein